MSNELLPCPFCGGAVEIELAHTQHSAMYGKRECWGVICRNTQNLGGTCAIQQIPSASKEAAIERWNRRTPPAASGQQEVAISGEGFFQGLKLKIDESLPPDVVEVRGANRVRLNLRTHEITQLAARPAPAQQESQPAGHVVIYNKGGSGEVRRIEPVDKPGVELAYALREGAFVYTRAPAPAALTDERIDFIARQYFAEAGSQQHCKDAIHDALATASAAPAEQARDAERWRVAVEIIESQGMTIVEADGSGKTMNISIRPGQMLKAVDAAIASQQKGGGHG